MGQLGGTALEAPNLIDFPKADVREQTKNGRPVPTSVISYIHTHPMTFKTIDTPITVKTEEKRSRFIAHLVPYHLFDETLQSLRQVHKKANHHVTAFRTLNAEHQIVEGAKDDGEPAGTSGMPILKVLIGANLIHVGIIVVRYFGGTKLGTGGLAQAYGGAAQAALAAATLRTWEPTHTIEVTVPFHQSAEMERAIALHGLKVLARDFTETGVTFSLEGAASAMDTFKQGRG